jgi:hypothetical protein
MERISGRVKGKKLRKIRFIGLGGKGRGRRSNRRKGVFYLISENEVDEGTEGRLKRLLHEITPA